MDAEPFVGGDADMRIDYDEPTEVEISEAEIREADAAGDAEMREENPAEVVEADMGDWDGGGGADLSSEMLMGEVDAPHVSEPTTTTLSLDHVPAVVSPPSPSPAATVLPAHSLPPTEAPSAFVPTPTSTLEGPLALPSSSLALAPVPLAGNLEPSAAEPASTLPETESSAPQVKDDSTDASSSAIGMVKHEPQNGVVNGEDDVVNSTVTSTANGIKLENDEDPLVETTSCTCDAVTTPSFGPPLQSARLHLVDLQSTFSSSDTNPTASSSSSFLPAPAVLLLYGNDTYSLFRRDVTDQDSTVLFGENHEQALYFDRVEKLLDALHDVFPDFKERQEELVMNFEAIGIALSEDNVYARQVSLQDFDRVHVGCGLSGRLQFTLELQPRFSTGFNALVEHVASLQADTSAGVLDNLEADEAAEDSIDSTLKENLSDVPPDELEPEPLEGAEGEVEGETEVAVDGDETVEWADDSVYEEGLEGDSSEMYADESEEGLEGIEEVEGEVEDYREHTEGEDRGEDSEQHEGEEGTPEDVFDLETALAELDSDDLAAVIEGAREDYEASTKGLEGRLDEAEGSAFEETADGVNEVTGEEVGDDERLASEIESSAIIPAGEDVVETNEDGGELGDETSEGVDLARVAEAVEVEGDGDVIAPAVEYEIEGGLAPPSEFVDEAVVETASLVEVDPATEVASALDVDAYSINYDDTPTGLGTEAPSIPLAASTTSIVDAAAASGSGSFDEAVVETGSQATGDSLEDNPDDVVIDYEEVFVPSTLASPVAAPLVIERDASGTIETDLDESVDPLSPKRSRSSLKDEADPLDELVESKRQRLVDPEPAL